MENKSRFVAEFDDPEPLPESKPDDYRTLFQGNNDDCFRMGIRFQRKATRLFAPFYRADMVADYHPATTTSTPSSTSTSTASSTSTTTPTSAAAAANGATSSPLAGGGFSPGAAAGRGGGGR